MRMVCRRIKTVAHRLVQQFFNEGIMELLYLKANKPKDRIA